MFVLTSDSDRDTIPDQSPSDAAEDRPQKVEENGMPWEYLGDGFRESDADSVILEVE